MHGTKTPSTLTSLTLALMLAGSLLVAADAQAHCQVPCGIYDDPARVARLSEDTATIAKAVSNINALAGKTDPQSMNQLVRWTLNKEEHASHIITVVAEYFLAQRVKPASGEEQAAYLKSLSDHHAVIVAAMKTKQTADVKAVEALQAAIDTMGKYYHSHE